LLSSRKRDLRFEEAQSVLLSILQNSWSTNLIKLQHCRPLKALLILFSNLISCLALSSHFYCNTGSGQNMFWRHSGWRWSKSWSRFGEAKIVKLLMNPRKQHLIERLLFDTRSILTKSRAITACYQWSAKKTTLESFSVAARITNRLLDCAVLSLNASLHSA